MKAKFIYEALGDVLKPKSAEDVDKELRSMSEKKLLDMMHAYDIDKKRIRRIESILIEKYPKILKGLENSSVKELLEKTSNVYRFNDIVDFEDYIIPILAKKISVTPIKAKSIFRLAKMIVGQAGDNDKTRYEILKTLKEDGLQFFKYFKGFEKRTKQYFDSTLFSALPVELLKDVLNNANPSSDEVDDTIEKLFWTDDKTNPLIRQKLNIFLEYLDKYPPDSIQPLKSAIVQSIYHNQKDVFDTLISKEYHKDLDLEKIFSRVYTGKMTLPKWFKEYKAQASGSYLAKYQDDLFKVMKLIAKGGSMYSAHDEFDPNRLTKNEQKELLELMKKISDEDGSK